MRRADGVLSTLACALTRHRTRWRDDGGKAFYFRAHPRVA
jgi:hypothetical protein